MAAARSGFWGDDYEYVAGARVQGSRKKFREQPAPSQRVTAFNTWLCERDESPIFVTAARRSEYTWLQEYRMLLEQPHLTHKDRFKLTLFLFENGYNPRTIIDLFQRHGKYDFSAWRSIFSTLEDLMSGEKSQQCGNKYWVYNMREGAWVKASYEGIARAPGDWGDKWWRRFLPGGFNVDQTIRSLCS